MSNYNYSEKLKHPKWQKKRLKILERAGWKCECCDDAETSLQVHHLKYKGENPWDCPDEYLEALCETCHEFREDFNVLFQKSLVPTRFCHYFWCWFEESFSGEWDCAMNCTYIQQLYDRIYKKKFPEEQPISSAKQPDQTAAPAAERPRDVHANSGNGHSAPPDGDRLRSTGNPGERKPNAAALSDLNQSGETLARSHTLSTFAAPPAVPDTAEQGNLCQTPNIRPN